MSVFSQISEMIFILFENGIYLRNKWWKNIDEWLLDGIMFPKTAVFFQEAKCGVEKSTKCRKLTKKQP